MAYRIELPQQISGLSEKDQIAQLHKYLYMQAEQLQWILNDLEASKTGTNNATQSADNNAAKLGDYVVEVYAAEGWTYKKWKEGTYELIGWFAVTPTSSEKGESLYKSNAITITTPFKINPNAVITGAASGDAWITGAYADANTIYIKIISDTPISTTASTDVHIRVVGTYPINTEA